jgi:hypothetical protein
MRKSVLKHASTETSLCATLSKFILLHKVNQFGEDGLTLADKTREANISIIPHGQWHCPVTLPQPGTVQISAYCDALGRSQAT